MRAENSIFFRPWQRWLICLILPGFILMLFALGILWWEQSTRWPSRRLGSYLLERNAGREQLGSVWKGILASRQTRTHLQETPPTPYLEPATLPGSLLQNRYWEARRSANFLVLRQYRRATPLHPERLSVLQMQELARSLQVFQQGKQLLANLSLSPDPYRIHARIRAQIALEDGSLFPLLHQRLLAENAPVAWDFVHMSAADERYWRESIDPALTPGSAEDSTLAKQAPQVADAVRSLVQTWADSLLAAEVRLLRTAWENGPSFQLRIVRNMDTFTGYAVPPGELPIPFDLPTRQAEELLGLTTDPEEEP